MIFSKKRAEEAPESPTAMDERKFSNAYILERASLPLPSANRQRVCMLMAITIIVAMGVAVAAAFGLEYLNKTAAE